MTSSVVTSAPSSPVPLRFRVEGMDCGSCAGKIETAVRRIPGVSAVKVSFATSMLIVEADPALVPAQAIESAVDALGYRPTQVASDGVAEGAAPGTQAAFASSEDLPWWRTGKAKVTAAAGVLVAVAYGLSLVIPERATWVFVAATAIAAFPIARRALSAARAGTSTNMERMVRNMVFSVC